MRKNKFSKIAIIFSMLMVLSFATGATTFEDPPLQGGPVSTRSM